MEALAPLLTGKSAGARSGGSDAGGELPAGADPYEDFDFMPYFEELKSEDDLRKTWRVFTKVKDVLDTGRRLENASWRMWFAKRSQGEVLQENEVMHELSALEKFDVDLQKDLQKMRQSTEGVMSSVFSSSEQKRFEEQDRRDRAKVIQQHLEHLVAVQEKHGLSEAVMDDVLGLANDIFGDVMDAAAMLQQQRPEDPTLKRMVVARLPRTYAEAQAMLERVRRTTVEMPTCAAFGHSLERNGANNFLLYLIRELSDDFRFTLMTPKEGPMREDFEALGCRVLTVDATTDTYLEEVRRFVADHAFLIANTIMRAEAVIAAAELGRPSLWVIHEAWPQDQFDHYAKEVFQMSHVDGDLIRSGFRAASRIVFPANVQKTCYQGLFEEHRAQVVYNGIPLAAINAFRASKSRDKVRAELGYGRTDLLVVHLGTICKRKGQLYTARAFSRLRNDEQVRGSGNRCRLLMVGARYIRDHEIAYQEEIKRELQASGAAGDTVILEIQKNVLPYYHAADIVVVPSLNEVLPLVICEAMAFERPVVASRIDGIPEALTDGDEGYLVEPADDQVLYERLKQLALDDALRVRMGKKGRERVLKQFSFRAMAERYREVIEEARKEKTAPAASGS